MCETVCGQGNLVVQQAAKANRSIYLSKSDFTNFKSCAGFSWLAKHQPHLVPDEADPGSVRRSNAGDEVELLVRQQFPDGILIDTEDMAEAVALTNAAIAGGAQTLFQPTVWTERGLLARADILTRRGESWVLGEVKATTSIKTEHVIDAGFQYAALREAGFDIAEVQLICLEKSYRMQGDLDPVGILHVTDITARILKHQHGLERDIVRALGVIQNEENPGVCLCDMGTRSQRCPTFTHFHPNIASGNTVYDLGGISSRKIEDVLARGYVDLVDWPDEVDVTPMQRRQIEVLRRGEPHVDQGQIRSFIGRLKQPFHFLDYETFQTAVPLFDGCGPWSQVPFQYSLHVSNGPDDLVHHEFMWKSRDECPVPALIAQLREEIGPVGSVIVWNKGFEESRNREMASMVPEAAEFLHSVNARMVDLMDVVRKGAWVHPAFNGSASIKKVLPVVAPELAYTRLPIGDGALASESWFEAVMGEPAAMSDAERERVFASLRNYCELDTLAMVRILDHLRLLVSAPLAMVG